mgnify:CR=1 FL=1
MKIAITGKMCSGKSTIAKFIKSHNHQYQIFSFGKKVKEVASDLFKMDPNHKDRTLLTSIGTKMREIDPDVWTKYMIHQTKDIQFCIIDDLRYQNEYEHLIKNDFKIIQLLVSPEIQEERIKQIYPNNFQDHLNNRNHISEKNEFHWCENHSPDLIIDTSQSVQIIENIILQFINKENILQKWI